MIGRARRAALFTVLGLACLVTLLCATLLIAAIRNDRAITNNMGVATAEVLSVAFDRTIIRYATPDGDVHTPPNGVLYPGRLAEGQLVRVQYDVTNPEVVRVAGRTAMLTLRPLGMTVGITWLVAGPLLWWIRRQQHRAAT